MPTYEYECPHCHEVVEHVCQMAFRPEVIICPKCHEPAIRIVSSFTPHDDHPVWLTNRLKATIQDDSERPIDGRKDLNAFCKKKGIVENPKSS